MKTIPLTSGKVALVDDADYPTLSQFKWWASGSYAYRHKPGTDDKIIAMHRELMNAPVDMCVDHIDGNPLNNCRSNLRLCTIAQNAHNMRKHRGASKYKGIHVGDRRGRKEWQSSIRINNTSKFLGRFKNEIDAAKAYDRAALEFYGPFARINFPDGDA